MKTLVTAFAVAALLHTGLAQDAPFLMPVDDVFSIAGRGTVVIGKVQRGTLRVGDTVDVLGFNKNLQSKCVAIDRQRKAVPSVTAGESCSIVLSGVPTDHLERGQMVALPGSVQACSACTARLEMTGKAKRALLKVFSASTSVQIDGDKLTLSEPVVLEPGWTFTLHEGGRQVGSGVVLSLSP